MMKSRNIRINKLQTSDHKRNFPSFLDYLTSASPAQQPAARLLNVFISFFDEVLWIIAYDWLSMMN